MQPQWKWIALPKTLTSRFLLNNNRRKHITCSVFSPSRIRCLTTGSSTVAMASQAAGEEIRPKEVQEEQPVRRLCSSRRESLD